MPVEWNILVNAIRNMLERVIHDYNTMELDGSCLGELVMI